MANLPPRQVRWPTRAGSVCAAALLVAAVVGLAAPAYAHSRLVGTSPTAHATVTEPVGEVTLTFNEPVKGRFSTIVVDGPGGVSYSQGAVRVIDNTAHQSVYPLRSGAYTVAWRIVSADGHPVSGEFAFTMTVPAGQEPTGLPPANPPVSTVDDTGAAGSWAWPAAGAVSLAVVVFAGVLARRRRAGRP